MRRGFPAGTRQGLLRALGAGLMGPALLLAAQADPALTAPTMPPSPPAFSDASDAQPLGLAEVLAGVRTHHPRILSADLDRRIAGARLLEKQGAFDPGLSLESDYLRYNDFSNRGKLSKAWDNDLSLQWLTRSGLKLSAGARYNDGDIKPPLYPTGGGGEYFMGMRMPLLRGFRINEKALGEMQAEMGIPLADAAFRQTRLSVLLQAASAYWQWVAAGQKLTVQRRVLELAQVRQAAIEARAQAGDLPSIDIIEARQETQRRQGSLTRATRDYQRQTFRLSEFLWEPNGMPSPLPAASVLPAAMAEPTELSDDDWLDARRAALENRPELTALALQKSVITLDRDYARNQRLPIADLFATPGVDTGSQSVGLTLRAGVSLVVPLRTRTADGLLQAAEYRLQSLDLTQRLTLQRTLLEVDDAVSAIRAAYGQYQFALQESDLARQLEQGEKDRFDYGDSTLFLVNQRERATAEVALKLLDMQAEYHQAVATLKAACGQL